MRQLALFTIVAAIALFAGSMLTFAAYAAPPTTTQAGILARSDSQIVSPSQAISSTEVLTGTAVLTDSSAVTEVQPITATVVVSDAVDEDAPATEPITATQMTDADLDAQYAQVIEGAIVANRTELAVRFFLEGQTYLLDPLRSLGLDLSRTTAVMNLYNCDATTPESDETCYWDPYLLDKDGFYEIVTGVEEGLAVNLTLREAGAPSASQIWIQNRTGKRETIVYRDATYEIPPSSVQEFSVEADALPTFFLRSCVDVNGEAACEWTPVVVDPGFYYGLSEKITAGGIPGSTVAVLALESIVGKGAASDGDTIVGGAGENAASDDTAADEPVNESDVGTEAATASTLPQIVCTLQVPALNVRSGPGLEYEIVTKVRGDGIDAATVLVEGRNDGGQWLAVSELVAAGGWITANANYVLCDSDPGLLPIAAVTDGRLSPTPEPVQVAENSDDGTAVVVVDPAPANGEEGEGAVAEATAPAPNIPEGLAMLIVNNGFDHDMRFTVDQKHRPESGPSEYDLKPGESASILIYPGVVPFSASSPWSGLGDNAEVEIAPNTSLPLWLFFMPDPDGSGEWILQF